MLKGLQAALVLTTLFAATAVWGQDKLIIPGTGDSQVLLRILGRAFQQTHPGTMIDIPDSIGSAGGIRAVINGKAQLARVGRSLKANEAQSGLAYRVFAYSPVVFAVNQTQDCVSGLSSQQVVAIYSGRIRNWSELEGCADNRIYVANREEGDSSLTVIKAKIPGFMEIATPTGEIVYSTPETVEILSRHPNTIGYLPLSAIRRTAIKPLRLDGVAPTPTNFRNGDYPLILPLALVWKESPSGLAREFVEFLSSAEGQRLIAVEGLVPAATAQVLQ